MQADPGLKVESTTRFQSLIVKKDDDASNLKPCWSELLRHYNQVYLINDILFAAKKKRPDAGGGAPQPALIGRHGLTATL